MTRRSCVPRSLKFANAVLDVGYDLSIGHHLCRSIIRSRLFCFAGLAPLQDSYSGLHDVHLLGFIETISNKAATASYRVAL